MRRNVIKAAAILMALAVTLTSLPIATGSYSYAAAKRPAKVTKLTKKAAGKNYITIKWGKVKSAKGYVVYRYDRKKWKKVKTLKKTVFKDKKLKAGRTYKYRVKAYTTVKQYYNTTTKKWVSKKPKASDWKTKKARTKRVYGKVSKTLKVKTKKASNSSKTNSKSKSSSKSTAKTGKTSDNSKGKVITNSSGEKVKLTGKTIKLKKSDGKTLKTMKVGNTYTFKHPVTGDRNVKMTVTEKDTKFPGKVVTSFSDDSGDNNGLVLQTNDRLSVTIANKDNSISSFSWQKKGTGKKCYFYSEFNDYGSIVHAVSIRDKDVIVKFSIDGTDPDKVKGTVKEDFITYKWEGTKNGKKGVHTETVLLTEYVKNELYKDDISRTEEEKAKIKMPYYAKYIELSKHNYKNDKPIPITLQGIIRKSDCKTKWYSSENVYEIFPEHRSPDNGKRGQCVWIKAYYKGNLIKELYSNCLRKGYFF